MTTWAILLLVTSFACCCESGGEELPTSLSVAKVGSLQLSLSNLVSPQRLEIHGLSRLTNLTAIFSSLKLNLNIIPPNNTSIISASVCFHRNASLGVGMCPEPLWENLTNGSWVTSMSPFDHKFLDIRSLAPSLGTLHLLLNQEFYMYRLIFFTLGVTLMTFAPFLSNRLPTYYASSMILGPLLVILVILFQGMRILPSGRKSSLALVLYGSIVGVGSFLFSYVPALLRSLLVEMGISEDLYSPVAALLLAFVVLCGAWLGFWAVRKLVLTEDGSIDTGVAKFVSWSIRIVASSMILQCSVDPLLAVAALVCGIVIPSAAKWLLIYYSPEMSRNKHKRSRKSPDENYSGYKTKPVSASPDEKSPRYNNKQELKLSDSDTFYSTFHNAPSRKHYSKDEWDKFTKESTKKALESLVWSPDFNRWAVANADRLALLPKKDTDPSRKSWFSWS